MKDKKKGKTKMQERKKKRKKLKRESKKQYTGIRLHIVLAIKFTYVSVCFPL